MSKVQTKYRPGDVLRVKELESHGSRLARFERRPRDGSPLLPVRFERYPTQAEVERGDYDRWVKSVTRINPERVIEIAERANPLADQS